MAPSHTRALPQTRGVALVTDGGLETDLIFRRGIDLPLFAAFPLLDDAAGREVLATYYEEYATIAAAAGAGLLLDSATWRANPDWGARLGYDRSALARINTTAVSHLHQLADRHRDTVPAAVVSGMIGPRDDGYRPGEPLDPDEAARYHAPQVQAFADAGADQVSALTMTHVGEAVGIVRAARAAGLPVALSFTLEVDGRLPDGSTLADAVTAVDEAAAPDYFMVNCSHPQHVAPAFAEPAPWHARVLGMRYNASPRSHAELDQADDLDRGDLDVLAAGHRQVQAQLTHLTVVGGCCGTDAEHVSRLWQSAPQ